MTKASVTTPVEGGWVTRKASSGRLVAVRTAKSASRANTTTEAVLKDASSRWRAALARLADR